LSRVATGRDPSARAPRRRLRLVVFLLLIAVIWHLAYKWLL
jgi:hypothetical protein